MKKCKDRQGCGYYDETMKLTVEGAMTMLFDDEFAIKIKSAINEYECDYFKENRYLMKRRRI